MMKKATHALHFTPALLLSAALIAPSVASAATLTASTAVEVGVADTDFSNLIDNLDTGSVTTDTDYSLYQYSSDYTADYEDWAFSNAAVNQDGWMYSSAGGDNTFKAASHVQQSLTISNETGVAQNYSFDFTILQGSLSAWDSGSSLEAGEFAASGYYVSITLDGVELFGSAALLVLDDGGVDLRQEGTELATWAAGDSYFDWDAYSDTLDLGEFAAGESFTLTYDIYTAAAGINTVTSGAGDEECYYGEIEIEVYEGYCGDWSTSYAQFGDPNGVSGSPIAGNVHASPVSPTSVPEPGIWLLMGTGLFGFAVARRRRG